MKVVENNWNLFLSIIDGEQIIKTYNRKAIFVYRFYTILWSIITCLVTGFVIYIVYETIYILYTVQWKISSYLFIHYGLPYLIYLYSALGITFFVKRQIFPNLYYLQLHSKCIYFILSKSFILKLRIIS